MKFVLDSGVIEIMDIINNDGYSCYLVGGAVRDYVIGNVAKDFDLCTDMPLDVVKEKIPQIIIMKENSHRNTGIIKMNGYCYEISAFRGNSLEEDLFNRDFCMNAMAIDRSGNLIDPYNGYLSINNKVVSLIDSSGSAFVTDPLRILRAIRQSYELGFTIDDNCLRQMDLNKSLLCEVASERVYDEFKKILLFDNASDLLYRHKNILFEIIPELARCDGFIQNNDYHIYDVLGHILKVVENTKSDLVLRLAALFHDIGKPDRYVVDDKGVGHFYGHPGVSCEIFKKFANKYKVDNKTKRIVCKLILEHENQLSGKSNKIYDFYKRFGLDNVEELFLLKRADALGQSPKYLDRLDKYDELLEKYLDVRDTLKNISVDGNALIGVGITGKKIKDVLDYVNLAVVCGQVKNEKQEVLSFIKRKYLGK